MKQKVESHPNLERDVNTKAVINTDSLAYNRHKMRRKAAMEQKEKIQAMESEISRLNNMMEIILNKLDTPRETA